MEEGLCISHGVRDTSAYAPTILAAQLVPIRLNSWRAAQSLIFCPVLNDSHLISSRDFRMSCSIFPVPSLHIRDDKSAAETRSGR